jgi:hypothetical protein
MTVTYSWKGPMARVLAEGLYEWADAKSVLLKVVDDPAAPDVVALLVDLSRSDSRRSPDELRDLAELLARHRDKIGGRAAFVASKPLQYGLARMLEVFSDSRQVTVRAFYNDDEAVTWLTETQPQT